MDHRPLFFSSQPQIRKKVRTTKIEFPRTNIYTSLFQPTPVASTHNLSSSSTSKEPRNYYGFVNPKPVHSQPISFNHVQQPQRTALVPSQVLDLQSRVQFLRRAVSEKKLRSENKLSDLAIRAERLKQKYLEQDRQLGKIVQAIHTNFK